MDIKIKFNENKQNLIYNNKDKLLALEICNIILNDPLMPLDNHKIYLNGELSKNIFEDVNKNIKIDNEILIEYENKEDYETISHTLIYIVDEDHLDDYYFKQELERWK